MARRMFNDREHAAAHQTFHGGAGKYGHDLSAFGIGAIADHFVSALPRHVENRNAVDVDAEVQEILGDQTRGEARGTKTIERSSVFAISSASKGLTRYRPCFCTSHHSTTVPCLMTACP